MTRKANATLFAGIQKALRAPAQSVAAARRPLPAPHSVNATTRASLWRGDEMVGMCAYTPNAIAYAFKVTGADRAVSAMLGTTTRASMAAASPERLAAGGWMKSSADAELTLT